MISPAHPLPIGSVKGNVGHLETASAGASIIKALLMLQRKTLVPTASHETPNPNIDFKGMGLDIVTSVRPFPADIKDPLIGINSFGFGGANGHLILAGLPDTPTEKQPIGQADRATWMEPEEVRHELLTDPTLANMT